MTALIHSAQSDYLSVVGVLVFVTALAVVAHDRRALKRELSAAQGSIAGLTIDLALAQDKVEELFGYLSEHDNWNPDGCANPAPAQPVDLNLGERWSGSAVATPSRSVAALGRAGVVLDLPAEH